MTQPSPQDIVRQELDELVRQLESLRKMMSVEYDEVLAWEQRARVAIGDGRDDLARDALERFNEHREHAEQLRIELDGLEEVVRNFREATRELLAQSAQREPR